MRSRAVGWIAAACVALSVSANIPARAAGHSPAVVAALECAAIYSIALEGTADETAKLQIASVITYFVGRAEGLEPGIDFEQALTPALMKSVVARHVEVELRCQAEALAIGQKLTAAGKALTGE